MTQEEIKRQYLSAPMFGGGGSFNIPNANAFTAVL
jgi:hypothetical protein